MDNTETAKFKKRLLRVRTVAVAILVFVFLFIGYYTATNRFHIDPTKNKAPKKVEVVERALAIEGWVTYTNDEFGVSLQYPPTWRDSGDASSFTNPDLLDWRSFIPNNTVGEFVTNPEMVTLSIFRKNQKSSYSNPKDLLEKQLHDNWNKTKVNGYPSIKITHTLTGDIEYVFDRGDRLYVLSSTKPEKINTILNTIKFIQS